MEMEVTHIVQLLAGSPAYAADRYGGFIGSLWPQADERNQVVILWDCLCSRQGIDLIISAVLLFDDAVVILPVERPVLHAVDHLLLFCRPQDCRQRVAEVHRADFLALGGADLGFKNRDTAPAD